jgi:tetratricopeptide (TPR) repeat protein
LDSGNIAKSIEDFNEALKLAPNFAEAYLDRGYAYYRLREYDRGIADCTKVISLEPDNKVAYTYRGLMWARKVTSRRDMDTINKAIADFEKAIQIDPDFAPAIKEYARFRATWVDIPR